MWPPTGGGSARAAFRRRDWCTSGTRRRSSARPSPTQGTGSRAHSSPPRQHHLLDLTDRLGRIQTLRARARAIHDGVAAIELEGILKVVEPLARVFVARIHEPTVRLQQDGGTEVSVAIPPVTGACRGA